MHSSRKRRSYEGACRRFVAEELAGGGACRRLRRSLRLTPRCACKNGRCQQMPEDKCCEVCWLGGGRMPPICAGTGAMGHVMPTHVSQQQSRMGQHPHHPRRALCFMASQTMQLFAGPDSHRSLRKLLLQHVHSTCAASGVVRVVFGTSHEQEGGPPRFGGGSWGGRNFCVKFRFSASDSKAITHLY